MKYPSKTRLKQPAKKDGRETEKRTANLQLPKTVGVVFASQPHFADKLKRFSRFCGQINEDIVLFD